MTKSKSDILRIIRPRFETDEAALNWFENEELPGFDGLTAAQLVEQRRADDVITYFDAVDAGIHA